MLCPICKCTDFESLDYLRVTPEKFVICKGCGNVTYERTKEELEKMYQTSSFNEKRKYPGTRDLATKFHKLTYFRKVLKDFLEGNKLKVLDIGCSTGYVLNEFKKHGHEVCGLELNPAHAEMGRREYGLEILNCGDLGEFKQSKRKFDLIICFAVLEHMLDPVANLNHMKDLLEKDGHIFLMTPVWFKSIYNSQFRIEAFEGLYVPEHLNCFSEISRQNCFNLAGLETIYHNDKMYGDMVILKNGKVKEITKEDYKHIQTRISNEKKAIECMFKQQYKEALEFVKEIPDAHHAFGIKNFKNSMPEYRKYLVQALECFETSEIKFKMADSYFQENNYIDAERWLLETIEMNPTQYEAYFRMAEIRNIEKKFEESNEWLMKLIGLNPKIEDNTFNKDGLTPRDLLGINYLKLSEL